MMMKLSVEEVAFVMGALGEPDAAAGFLAALVGRQERENLSGRITAATHSLIARGLLQVDATTGQNQLDAPLAQMVQVMLTAGRSLRCQSQTQGEERVSTIFLPATGALAGGGVAHELSLGVVAALETLPDATAISRRLGSFMGAPDLLAAVTAVPPVPQAMMSTDAVQRARQYAARRDSARLQAALAAEVSAELVDELATDWQNEEIAWGSILLLESANEPATPSLTANEGLLYAALPDKVWLLRLTAVTPERAALYRGDTAVLSAFVQEVLQAGA